MKSLSTLSVVTTRCFSMRHFRCLCWPERQSLR